MARRPTHDLLAIHKETYEDERGETKTREHFVELCALWQGENVLTGTLCSVPAALLAGEAVRVIVRKRDRGDG